MNAIQLVLSLALYYPFFKMYERRFIEKEIENENKGSSLLTDEDQAIHDDLDLGISLRLGCSVQLHPVLEDLLRAGALPERQRKAALRIGARNGRTSRPDSQSLGLQEA